MKNKMKFIIEMVCEVEGDVAKLREVANAATDGIEVNTTDIEGVSEINVTLHRAIKTVEEDVCLDEEEIL